MGIISPFTKHYTPAQRKLYTATSGGGIVPVDPILNWLSGRTAMLKKEVEVEKKETLMDKIEGNKISVSFTHANKGLMVKIDSVKPVSLYGFAIAGEDKKFYQADAVIDGNKVVVSSKDVAKPVAVRYAWADFSFQWNLFNTEGYPASTFRTDNWDLK